MHAAMMDPQVEIMMALEEKFDLQMDEEGECCACHTFGL